MVAGLIVSKLLSGRASDGVKKLGHRHHQWILVVIGYGKEYGQFGLPQEGAPFQIGWAGQENKRFHLRMAYGCFNGIVHAATSAAYAYLRCIHSRLGFQVLVSHVNVAWPLLHFLRWLDRAGALGRIVGPVSAVAEAAKIHGDNADPGRG